MKKLVAFFLATVLVSTQSIMAFGNSNANFISAKKLNIRNQIIRSEKLNYSIKIPDTWINYISIEDESPNSKLGIVEKHNFYYEPKSTVNKPLLLMSLFVFNKVDWYNMTNDSYKKITEDVNYVYATMTTSTNPYTSKEDQTIFKRLTIEANNREFVENMMLLQDKTNPKAFDTITVNSEVLNSKVLYINGGIAYLPIRETCEALGYKITWREKENMIIISKAGQNSIRFYTKNPSKNSGYSIKVENSISYVNYSFFIWSLKANVEIDENKNIYIRKD